MEEKHAGMISTNGVFYRIKKFFRELFSKNNQTNSNVNTNLDTSSKDFIGDIKIIDNISEIKKHIENLKINREKLQGKSIEELKEMQNVLNTYIDTLDVKINNEKNEIIQYDKIIDSYKKQLA